MPTAPKSGCLIQGSLNSLKKRFCADAAISADTDLAALMVFRLPDTFN